MRTIAIMNLKGGVAKTTTAVNVAAILAHDYRRWVLVVDADSQCNATEFLGADPERGNLADLLRGDCAPGQGAISATEFDRISIIAGSDQLMDLDLTKVVSSEVDVGALRKATERLNRIGAYDFCLIDCPPAFNTASAAALLAADEVMIPIKLDAFSLRGMTNLMRQISNMRAINGDLTILGILPTMWYRSDNIIEAEATLRAHNLYVLPHIRRTNKVDDMTFAQRPIISTAPHSAAAMDYRTLTRVLLRGGAANG